MTKANFGNKWFLLIICKYRKVINQKRLITQPTKTNRSEYSDKTNKK